LQEKLYFLLEKYWKKIVHTEGVTDLDKQIGMIIFESILTTFELSLVFRGSIEAVLKTVSCLKPTYHEEI